MKWIRLALPAGILLAGSVFAALPARAAAPAYVDNEVRDRLQQGGRQRVIIQLGDASHPEIWAPSWRQRVSAIRTLTAGVLSRAPGLEVHRRLAIFPLLSATVDEATLQRVAQLPEVEAIFPDRVMKAVLDNSGPLIGQPQAEAAGHTGAGIGVAVLDTGVDYTHPAFNVPSARFFSDVKPGFWAWTGIEGLAQHGIVSGYGDGSYQPAFTVSRDQMAAFIARSLVGEGNTVPDPAPGTQSFGDVPPDFWAYKDIEYCKAQNIVGGYADGYHPLEAVDRGQMAAFIARSIVTPTGEAGLASYTPPATPSFSDVPAGAWNYKDVEYIKSVGIVGGYPDGLYHPEIICARDQMAVFVSRAFHFTWGGRVTGGVNLLLPVGNPARLDPMDDHYHGTMVAGVVASMDTTYRGIAPAANLVPVKVLDSVGSGYSSDVIAGIEWCIQNKDLYGLKVVNLSLGDGTEWTDHESCDAQPEGIAVQDAVNAGLFVAIASGNEGFTKGISLPACASAAVSVGATTDGDPGDPPADSISTYADRGELMTLYAPGTHTTAPHLGGGFITGAGTSFASPHVAGAAAVLAGMGITDPAAIRARLTQTGTQLVDATTLVASPRVNLVTAMNPPATGPDLVVTAVSSPASSAFTGDTINLAVTVKNQGTAASGTCQAIVVLSANTVISPQDYVLTSVSVPALGPGATYSPGSLTGLVPAVTGGSYRLGAYADNGYTVAEFNEVNNAFMSPTAFTVSVPSAHVVSATFPATMQAGVTYPGAAVTMLNDGTTAWTPGQYTLQAVAPEGTNRWGTTSVGLNTTVNPGAQYTFTFSVTAPLLPGAYACHWRMNKAGAFFGEVATGATVSLMVDDTTAGEDYPAADGTRVAFMDYKNGTYAAQGVPAVSVKDVTSGQLKVLPDSIPGLINPGTGYPDPPYTYFDISNNWFPSVSGTWVSWMSDDQPSNPSDPSDPNAVWYFQIVAYNLATPAVLPVVVTEQNADAWYPSVDAATKYVVWEDYRNDPDGLPDLTDFTRDNPDIYLADLNDVNSGTHHPKVYPICTAAGPQFAPRISGHWVVWEDWRDGVQGDIYAYDLSLDSDGNGTPNWQESPRPSPDPAERRLTDTAGTEGYPDVSGSTAVWLDYSHYTGPGGEVDIISEDLDTSVQTPVVTSPAAYRQQVRIDGTQLVWEDWRNGAGDVYWTDLNNPEATALLGGSPGYEGVPDIGGGRVAYSKFRLRTGGATPTDVYNVWSQKMLPYVTVTP